MLAVGVSSLSSLSTWQVVKFSDRNGDGLVGYHEFCQGLLDMDKSATKCDVWEILCMMAHDKNSVESRVGGLEKQLQDMGGMMQSLHAKLDALSGAVLQQHRGPKP